MTLVTGAMALAFDDTFHVMVGAAIIGAVLGLLLRRNLAAQAALDPSAATDDEDLPRHMMVG